MNEPVREMQRFVEHYGTQKKAGEAIGLSQVAVWKLLHRRQDFSPRVLRRLKAAWPAINLDAILEVGDFQPLDQEDPGQTDSA